MRLVDIGHVLRERRVELGLSVRAAAARTTIGHAQWSHIENGGGTTLRRIEEVAQSVGLEIDVTITRSDDAPMEPAKSELVQGLIAVLPRLDERDVEWLQHQLEFIKSRR